MKRARSDLIGIDQGQGLMTRDPTTLGTKELALTPPPPPAGCPGYGSRGTVAALLKSLPRAGARTQKHTQGSLTVQKEGGGGGQGSLVFREKNRYTGCKKRKLEECK